ncbi:hypothetical protein CKO12_04785 [Chromatium okenii]|uniref:hypothetical protein n=1 Tax=Chromatium okenii TaxID=61644 RepID=UPI001905BBCF|nr:hypothetical protein [Chromatium okenii]MBK1641200.1 hypothetical protein [Chromatium okenii]
MTARIMQSIFKPFIHPVAAFSLLALTLGNVQAGVTIDHFTNSQLVRNPANVGESSSNTIMGGDFIGTSREMSVDRNGLLGSSYAESHSGNPSTLVIGNSGNATGIVVMQWNDILDINLTEAGAEGVFLSFTNPIDRALTITFNAFDDVMNVNAIGSKTFADQSQGLDFFIPFATFSNSNVLKSVNTLTATFTSVHANWDANIDYIETRDMEVPTPGILSLMVIGLTGLGFSRHRRV